MLYSDQWRLNSELHKSYPIWLTNNVNVQYWKNTDDTLVGVTINFEYSDDIHYELEELEWVKFLVIVLKWQPYVSEIKLFANFLKTDLPHIQFEDALKQNDIKYKKIAFY